MIRAATQATTAAVRRVTVAVVATSHLSHRRFFLTGLSAIGPTVPRRGRTILRLMTTAAAAATPREPLAPAVPSPRPGWIAMRLREWVVLGLILLLAGTLRVVHIADDPLWLDEVYTLE